MGNFYLFCFICNKELYLANFPFYVKNVKIKWNAVNFFFVSVYLLIVIQFSLMIGKPKTKVKNENLSNITILNHHCGDDTKGL